MLRGNEEDRLCLLVSLPGLQSLLLCLNSTAEQKLVLLSLGLSTSLSSLVAVCS